MTSGIVSARVVAGRLAMITDLLAQIRSLPLTSREKFFADRRNALSAESCLRRALEALLDIGRHILAKGYGVAVSEYKQVPARLKEVGALADDEANALNAMAGYRNRLVHFYYEVTDEELYDICSNQLGDIERICNAYRRWFKQHPDRVDTPISD